MDFTQLFGGMVGLSIFIALCTIVPFLAIAGFLVFSARRSNAQAQASQTWPSVMGKVTASSVEVSTSSDSDGGTSTSYYPAVTYDYEVLGHRYSSNRVVFGFRVGSGNRAQAQTVVDRYIPGNSIRVYYNPNNPGEAVLERTSQSSNIVKWIAILIVVIVCITLGFTGAVIGGVSVMLNDIFKNLPIK